MPCSRFSFSQHGRNTSTYTLQPGKMNETTTLPRLRRDDEAVALPSRVLQFGGGNFLRAFATWMVQEMNDKAGFGGGIILVKPTPGGTYRELRDQEGLFTVWTNGIQQGREVEFATRVAAIQEVLHPYEDFDRYLATARLPELRFIISNTTEAGIRYDAGQSFADRPSVNFPAKLTRWLYERWQHFAGAASAGVHVLPTELLARNGDALRELTLRYAREWQMESAFIDWLTARVRFYNTLVDRIVPGYPNAERAVELANELGYRDEALVVAEPYHLWAIEDDGQLEDVFPARASGLNVVYTQDLDSYNTRKVRVLNGAHTALVPLGWLRGHRTVDACLRDEGLQQYLQTFFREAVFPTLSLPEAEKSSYADAVLDRFRNRFLHHKLSDIALNSTSKFKTRLLPTLRWHYEQGRPLPATVMRALAALLLFYRGHWRGEATPLRDEDQRIADIQVYWQAHPEQPGRVVEAVLRRSDWWEEDLTAWPGLVEGVSRELRDLLAGERS